MKSHKSLFLVNSSSFLSSLFEMRGRISRRAFCYYMLFYVVACMLAAGLETVLVRLSPAIGQLVVLALVVPLVGAMLCQESRRYHDFGVSAWIPGGFLLLNFMLPLLWNYVLSGLFAPEVYEIARVVFSALGFVVLFAVPAIVPGGKSVNRYGRPVS